MTNINKVPLVAELRLAKKFSEPKSTIPVLNNARLTAKDGKLTITTTNLAEWFESELEFQGKGSFDVLVPIVDLLAITTKLSGDLSLRAKTKKATRTEKTPVPNTGGYKDGKYVEPKYTSKKVKETLSEFFIKCGAQTVTVQGHPIEDWPERPTVGLNPFAAMPAEPLRAALGQVAYAVSASESRFQLNAIHLQEESGTVRAAATDGHRLAVATFSAKRAKGLKLLIPGIVFREIQRLAEGTVEVFTGKAHHCCMFGTRRFIFPTPEGAFPDVQAVITLARQKSKSTIELDTAQSLAAAKRTLVVAKNHLVQCAATKTGFNLEIAKSVVKSSESTDLFSQKISGPNSFSVNNSYLVDVLSTLKAERVQLSWGDTTETAPLLLQPMNTNGANTADSAPTPAIGPKAAAKARYAQALADVGDVPFESLTPGKKAFLTRLRNEAGAKAFVTKIAPPKVELDSEVHVLMPLRGGQN